MDLSKNKKKTLNKWFNYNKVNQKKRKEMWKMKNYKNY